MIGGVLHLNGQIVPKVRKADFEIAVSAPTRIAIAPEFEAQVRRSARNGLPLSALYARRCPAGESYDVLDLEHTPQDDYGCR